MANGRGGRKTKYTDEVVGRILYALEKGATYELACHYAGISFETFNEWRKAKPEFSEQVKLAEGSAALGWLAVIERAADDGQWQAAAWKLERRYPHMYGRTVQETHGKHEHSGPNGQPIPISYFDANSALAALTTAASGPGEDGAGAE